MMGPVPEDLYVSDYKVYKTLSALKTKKSRGPDEIPNVGWKEFAFELSPALVDIYNSSLEPSYFPAQLKQAIVVPVPKLRPPKSFENDLRPISLTSPIAIEEFCKLRAKQEETREACTSQKCKRNVPRKRNLELVPIANLKFRKHEHGKLKKHRTPVISRAHDVTRAHVNNVNRRNTKLSNMYTEVMEFQVKTGRLLGLSHTLQQHTTKNIQKAVILDHS